MFFFFVSPTYGSKYSDCSVHDLFRLLLFTKILRIQINSVYMYVSMCKVAVSNKDLMDYRNQ